jgi:hypothetical protein
MIVNIQQNDYSAQIGSTAGVIVLVLPQYVMPFPEDFGLLVRPGYALSIGLLTVRAWQGSLETMLLSLKYEIRTGQVQLKISSV